jgi:hypothetical protein
MVAVNNRDTASQLWVQFLDSLIRRNGSVFFGTAINCRNKSQDLASLPSSRLAD